MLLLRATRASSLPRTLVVSRTFSSTSHFLTATPDWQTLVGGRAGILTSQKAFNSKYAAALEKKAKSDGVSVEEMMKRKQDEVREKENLARKERAAAMDGLVEAGQVEPVEGRVVKPLPSAEEEKQAQAKRERNGESSPIKVACSASTQTIVTLS